MASSNSADKNKTEVPELSKGKIDAVTTQSSWKNVYLKYWKGQVKSAEALV